MPSPQSLRFALLNSRVSPLPPPKPKRSNTHRQQWRDDGAGSLKLTDISDGDPFESMVTIMRPKRSPYLFVETINMLAAPCFRKSISRAHNAQAFAQYQLANPDMGGRCATQSQSTHRAK